MPRLLTGEDSMNSILEAETTPLPGALARSRRRTGPYVAVAVVLFFMGLAAAGVTRLMASLSDGAQGEMLAFVNSPVEIPAAWLAPRLAPGLEQRLLDYHDTATPRMGRWMGRWGERRSWQAVPPSAEAMTPEDWTALEAWRESRWPAQAALARLMAHPEFARRNVFAAYVPSIPPSNLEREARSPGRWLPRCVIADVHAGRWASACATALLYFRADQLPSPRALTNRRGAGGYYDTTTENMLAQLARQCTDATLLSSTLAAMAALVPAATPTDVNRALVEEIVAGVYMRSPADATRELEPGMLGRRLLRCQMNAWSVGADGNGDNSLSQRWDAWRDQGLSSLGSGDKKLFSIYTSELLGLSARSEEFMYWHMRRFIENALAAERALLPRRRAAFDLARLALAARIEELQGRPRPTRVHEFVPAYFSKLLLDPCTGRPYAYDPARASFISAGPDRQAHSDDDFFLDLS